LNLFPSVFAPISNPKIKKLCNKLFLSLPFSVNFPHFHIMEKVLQRKMEINFFCNIGRKLKTFLITNSFFQFIVFHEKNSLKITKNSFCIKIVKTFEFCGHFNGFVIKLNKFAFQFKTF
jgi:hypothetical protein